MSELLRELYAGIREREATAVVRGLLRVIAALVLIFGALIMFAPALGGSRFLYGTDTVSHDYIMHFYGWAQSIGEHGELPLWNPYMFSGMPMLASAALCPFYPSQWLYALLPFNTAFTLQYVLALALGGIGAAWWMRTLGHRRAVCFWAGVLYMVSGHFLTLVHAGHLQKMIALGWTPVALGATIQIMKFGRTGVKHSRRYKAAALLGIALGMQLLATHPQIFYATAAACVLQLVGMAFFSIPWKAVMTGAEMPDGSRPMDALRRIGRALALSLLALVVCCALAAVQLLPTWEMSKFSNRADGVSFAEATETSYPPLEVLEYAVPSIFGDSVRGSDMPYFGDWGERIVSDYIGLPVLLLALFGLFGSRRRYRWFLLILFFVGLIVGVGNHTPIYWILWKVVPGFDGFRSPGTFMFLSNCALIGLATFGLDYLLNLADSINSEGWGSSFTDKADAAEIEKDDSIGEPVETAARTADETQPFDVSQLAATDEPPPVGMASYYEETDTPPQTPALQDSPDYDDLEQDPGLHYSYPESPGSHASSNFTWDNENKPWLGRPAMLVFLAAAAVALLAAAIIALAENWGVDLKIATEAERMSHHTYSRVAGAAVAMMGLLVGILLLRMRTWVGGVVIGVVAVAFPLIHNYHYIKFEPLPPYMAHLMRQPDLQGLAKTAAQPVRLIEQNLMKNEAMLYGISSVAGYHPIVPRGYAEVGGALGFDSTNFGRLFAVNNARTREPGGPDGGQWALDEEVAEGAAGSRIWQRETALPYVQNRPVLALLSTAGASLTSATVNALVDAEQFGSSDTYVARVTEQDARKYRLVAGVQDVEASLQQWLPQEVRLSVKARAARNGAGVLLTVADPYFPGWHAETSRGMQLPVIAVNGAQRGAVVPPGEQNMRFIYAPYSFRLGLFISLFSATLLLFYAMGTITRRITRGKKKFEKAIKRAQTGRHKTITHPDQKGTAPS